MDPRGEIQSGYGAFLYVIEHCVYFPKSCPQTFFFCSRSTATASASLAALNENKEDTTTDNNDENDDGVDDVDDYDDDDDYEGDDDEGDEKEKGRGISWCIRNSKFVSWQNPVFCLFQCLFYSHGHI